ncbi:MAG: hypothetical protein KDG54_11390 [Geminicoccaceae bacterium]|nr:hypothetical protein [Geminicoccaceae bacterium]
MHRCHWNRLPHCLLAAALVTLSLSSAVEAATPDRTRRVVPVPQPKPAGHQVEMGLIEPAAASRGRSVSSFQMPGLVISVDHDANLLDVQLQEGRIPRDDLRHQFGLLQRAVQLQDERGDPKLTAGLKKVFDGLAQLALILDEPDAALLSEEQALALFDRMAPSQRGRMPARIARLETLDRWADLNFRMGNYGDAADAYREIAAETLQGEGLSRQEPAVWSRVARTMIKLAASRRQLGDRQSSIDAFQAAGFITRALLDREDISETGREPLSMQLAFIRTSIETIDGALPADGDLQKAVFRDVEP